MRYMHIFSVAAVTLLAACGDETSDIALENCIKPDWQTLAWGIDECYPVRPASGPDADASRNALINLAFNADNSAHQKLRNDAENGMILYKVEDAGDPERAGHKDIVGFQYYSDDEFRVFLAEDVSLWASGNYNRHGTLPIMYGVYQVFKDPGERRSVLAGTKTVTRNEARRIMAFASTTEGRQITPLTYWDVRVDNSLPQRAAEKNARRDLIHRGLMTN